MRNTSGLRRGGGRPKGAVNKATRELREVMGSLFDDGYWRSVQKRLKAGTLAPAVEVKLLAYCYGEPKQRMELTGADGQPLATRVVFGGRYRPDSGHGAS